MAEIAIRKAEPSDVDALIACIDSAYAQYRQLIFDLPNVSEGVAEDIATNQAWVAQDADVVVGGVFMIAGKDAMKLANLAVHPNHGGKGIGRALMELVESEALSQGYSEMRLNTHTAIPENVSIYTHLGWEEFSREGTVVSMRKYLAKPK